MGKGHFRRAIGGSGGLWRSQFLPAQIARRGPWDGCTNLLAVVQTAFWQTQIGLVVADAEFDSDRTHSYDPQATRCAECNL
jgi:hypothetical protein